MMKIHNLRNLQLDDLYWILKFGFPKKKGTIYALRQESFANLPQPVFFLSTGRCGTKWFSNLLKKDKQFKVLHAPDPTFAMQGKLVYELFKGNPSSEQRKLMEEIFLSGRESFLRYSYKCSRNIIESNNYVTFFAPLLYELFPHAKFVHLYRHPGEFVRSGINRLYYTGKKNDDIKRIQPIYKEEQEQWEHYSQIEKISWLWRATNEYIESFKENLPEGKVCSFNFNQLNPENVMGLVKFIGANITRRQIEKKLYKKANVQRSVIKEHFTQWPEHEKEQLRNVCWNLADKYGYSL